MVTHNVTMAPEPGTYSYAAPQSPVLATGRVMKDQFNILS